jgi:hypothetical protein
MEKKDKKQRDIVLSQDNALTTARYKFDLIEKRALYSIIRNIRAQYIENENGRRDLFDDLIITIHEEELKKCGDKGICSVIFIPKSQQPVFYFVIECSELPYIRIV